MLSSNRLSHAVRILLVLIGLSMSLNQPSNAQEIPELGAKLTDKQVAAFAKLALDGMDREYPNKPSNVMVGPESVLSPKAMHPAFYGCFDWHSSVHGHWMLIRLLKEYPGSSVEAEIRNKLSDHLTKENLQVEADYYNEKENKSFERMYGWAWTLRLAAELHNWDDADGKVWRENFRPLENKIVELTKGYLPRLSFPIRTGQHPDVGFALGQILDYARLVGDTELEGLILKRAKDYYLADKKYPFEYEPSGEDFFSSGLNEADLMRRVLPQEEFINWFEAYFPNVNQDDFGRLLQPVEVPDVTDGKLVHLAGLDLSRGWTLQGIASALPKDSQMRKRLEASAKAHAQLGYRYVFSGHYEGEHWLATFAIYLHTRVGTAD